MLTLGILISGRGSNMQALIAACAMSGFPARVGCVISNKDDATGLEIARQAGIPAFAIPHRDYTSREAFEAEIDRILNEHGVNLVCQAGFMRILTPWFVDRWLDRLINIHPSLLPAFPGLDVQQKAINAGVKLAGCTVHFVRAAMDAGPIIGQAAVPVHHDDTADSLSARILTVEHKLYPHCVRLIGEGRVSVHNEKVIIASDEALSGFLAYPD